MLILKHEDELLKHQFVVIGRHPRPHFRTFYPLLFDRIQNVDIVGYEEHPSDHFLEHFTGYLICLAGHCSKQMMQHKKHYSVILISHGPVPVSHRGGSEVCADHFITNGSEKLLEKVNLKMVSQTLPLGYFPTDYFSKERCPKTALVQCSGSYKRSLKLTQICRILLERNFDVRLYEHLMYPSGVHSLPEEVKKIRAGLEYVQALSSCSHFIFSGTSGFLTSAYSPGCCQINVSADWRNKNSELFQDCMDRSCYTVNDEAGLISALNLPPRYDEQFTSFLYGENRGNVIEKINGYLIDLPCMKNLT